jgi:hypothetical protein
MINFVQNQCTCTLEGLNGCVFIDNADYGYVYPFTNQVINSCGCGYTSPFNVLVGYESGLSTGTSMLPPVLNALTILADIALKDITDPHANEGVGDIGVQQWSSMGYSEIRTKLANSAFGSSARANRAMKLVEFIKRKKALRLR